MKIEKVLRSLNSRTEYLPQLSNISDFIPGENLILGEVLGEGEFGAVYEGVYIGVNGTSESVAIKTLRESHNNATRDEFLREARLMTTLKHHCIVKLIGFSEGPPLLMVVTFFLQQQNKLSVTMKTKENDGKW